MLTNKEEVTKKTICQIDFLLCFNPAGDGNCGKDQDVHQFGCPLARNYLLNIAKDFAINNPGPLKLVSTGDTVLSLRKQAHSKNIIRVKGGTVENNLIEFSSSSSLK